MDGAGWGVLVFTIGLSAALGTASPAVGHEFEDLQSFIASFVITLPSMFAFGVLFGAALLYRKCPVNAALRRSRPDGRSS